MSTLPAAQKKPTSLGNYIIYKPQLGTLKKGLFGNAELNTGTVATAILSSTSGQWLQVYLHRPTALLRRL